METDCLVVRLMLIIYANHHLFYWLLLNALATSSATAVKKLIRKP
jgi:hypothetical protein